MFASLCDFVIITLLLPFLGPRVLSVHFFSFSIVFSDCYHWWVCFLVWLLSSSFLSVFFFFSIFYYFLIFLIYNNFLF